MSEEYNAGVYKRKINSGNFINYIISIEIFINL